MDSFFTNSSSSSSSTTSNPIPSLFQSSNSSISQPNMSHSQMNAHISDNTAFPTPYSSYNYNPSMNHPQYQGYPYLIPNTPEVQAQREEDRKKMEAYRCKIAREQRKQLLQKRRSTPSKASEGTRQPIYIQVREPIVPNVFFTPDGKRLEEILTKKLKNSDVTSLGRIILPKREAEEKLPALSREGMELVLNDVYSELEWKVKFKFWINGKTRMYVLENTGNLVKHYKLHAGDFVTLYEDEFKNMYMSIHKDPKHEELELIPCAEHAKDKEPNPLSCRETDKTTSIRAQTILENDVGNGDGDDDDDQQQTRLNEVYESLQNIFDVCYPE